MMITIFYSKRRKLSEIVEIARIEYLKDIYIL